MLGCLQDFLDADLHHLHVQAQAGAHLWVNARPPVHLPAVCGPEAGRLGCIHMERRIPDPLDVVWCFVPGRCGGELLVAAALLCRVPRNAFMRQ